MLEEAGLKDTLMEHTQRAFESAKLAAGVFKGLDPRVVAGAAAAFAMSFTDPTYGIAWGMQQQQREMELQREANRQRLQLQERALAIHSQLMERTQRRYDWANQRAAMLGVPIYVVDEATYQQALQGIAAEQKRRQQELEQLRKDREARLKELDRLREQSLKRATQAARRSDLRARLIPIQNEIVASRQRIAQLHSSINRLQSNYIEGLLNPDALEQFKAQLDEEERRFQALIAEEEAIVAAGAAEQAPGTTAAPGPTPTTPQPRPTQPGAVDRAMKFLEGFEKLLE
jgi:DNA topoisomerase VI subunit B